MEKEVENQPETNETGRWTDQKKWTMGIVATLLASATVTFLFSPIKEAVFDKNDSTTVTGTDLESAGALIVDKRKEGFVMLGVIHISEERGLVFSPPAGETERDESPTATAVRETLEETGFTLTNLQFIEKAPAGNRNFSLVAGEIDETVTQQDPLKHDGIGMIWADPTRIPPGDWRFPEQREWIINKFQDRVKEMR